MAAMSSLVRTQPMCCVANSCPIAESMHSMQPCSNLVLRSNAALHKATRTRRVVVAAATAAAGRVTLTERTGSWSQLASSTALVEELRGAQFGKAGPETPVVSPPDFPDRPTGPEVPIPTRREPDSPTSPPEFPGGMPGIEVPSPTIPGPGQSPGTSPGPIIGGLEVSAIVTPPQPVPPVGPGTGSPPPFPGNPGNPTPPPQTPPQTPGPGGPAAPPFPKNPGQPPSGPAPPTIPGPGTGPGTA